MRCKGCGEDKNLIKAHIIPESFFRGLRGGNHPPRIISNVEGTFAKKAPIGIYDQEILCRECENRFQTLDDYGSRLLINEETEQEELFHNGSLVGYRINNLDYELLKSFFVSVLWRASVSKHDFYKNVSLGRLESKARSFVWGELGSGIQDFAFVLAKFDDDGAGRTIMNPHNERWYGIRYYRFYIYGYILYIKADSQNTPDQWKKFIPTDENMIIVSRGVIEDSKEFPILVHAAKMNTKT